MTSHLGCR